MGALGGMGGVFWGGGFGIQKVVYQKWPNQIFPVVNFIFFRDGRLGFSRDGRLGLGRGEGGFGGGPPLGFPLFFKSSWGGGGGRGCPPPVLKDAEAPSPEVL